MSRLFRSKRRTVLALVVVILIFCVSYVFHENYIKKNEAKSSERNPKFNVIKDDSNNVNTVILGEENIQNDAKIVTKREDRIESLTSNKVHAFYYMWYGNPEFNGKYYHWNHRFLPHWEKRISKLYATGERHIPPDDIGANFYPVLGPYSSHDPAVIQSHMEQFNKAGIGVLSLSWYPDGKADDEGFASEHFIPHLFDIADLYGIKICFHIEPYSNRNAATVGRDIKSIIEKYGKHPAFYKTQDPRDGNKILPLIYIYDSYLTPSLQWSKLLTEGGSLSIRGTANDAIVIGLLVENQHRNEILKGGFDGFYTYFSSDGFSYGSSWKHWKDLSSFAVVSNLLFIPSVGPGYIDTNIRPWNGRNTKHRSGGEYYETGWKTAIETESRFVSITSFNEWHEGTQIEPAAYQKSAMVGNLLGKAKPGNFTYLGYGPDPDLYLTLTRKWISEFERTFY